MTRKQLTKPRKGNKRKPPKNIHHPYYWPTWLGLGAMRLASLLPIPVLNRLGDYLGTLLWAAIPSRRHVVRTNIRLAFPHLNREQQRNLERAHFRSAARGMLEGSLAWWASDERLRPRTSIEGLEHLQQARQYGRGVILLMPHYTTMEICGKIINYHIPDFHPVYKPTKDRAFNHAMVKVRQANLAGLIPNDNMRDILRTLKRRNVVWYAPDQDFGRSGSVFAPFMGVQTSTLTMTSRLARISRAPVLPIHCVRTHDNRWHVRIEPALEDFPSEDEVADATRINQAIERQVRHTPEQYLWLHRRFKTRPDPREPSPYRRS